VPIRVTSCGVPILTIACSDVPVDAPFPGRSAPGRSRSSAPQGAFVGYARGFVDQPLCQAATEPGVDAFKAETRMRMEWTRDRQWSAISRERERLAADLEQIAEHEWNMRSQCGSWTVEETVAHLTAAASIGRWQWLRSMVTARFDADLP